jgi:signal transduction histidine kinase
MRFVPRIPQPYCFCASSVYAWANVWKVLLKDESEYLSRRRSLTAEAFLDITEPFPDAIILLSGNGAILAGNSAAHTFFAVNKLAGLEFSDLVIDTGQYLARCLLMWSASRRMVPADFELRRAVAEAAIRCDGAVISAVTAEAAPLLVVRCALRSQATDTGLLMRQIEVLHERLAEERNREQERLAFWEASAAAFVHEFGNPLNAISTSLQLIKLDLAGSIKDPMIRDTLFELSGETQRLSSLLQEFRSFSRAQSLKLKSADLQNSIRELLAAEMPGFQAAGVQVEFEFSSDLPPVAIDVGRLNQAVLNVWKNSVEAMPQGGTLTIKGYRDKQAVVLEVADTGVGVCDGIDVFQLFTTTKAGGSGLGLPLARQIIWAHNGSIDLIGKPGRGTICRIRLPAQSPP